MRVEASWDAEYYSFSATTYAVGLVEVSRLLGCLLVHTWLPAYLPLGLCQHPLLLLLLPLRQVGAGRRVFQLMDRTPQLPPSGTLKPTGSPDGASLEFKNVYFAYPSRPDSWVLSGFSLAISPGQSVALVGSSGGGKSTVVKLVQR
jgi:ABC-type multidrug transport system fused ATPase/permease subunit